MFKPDAPHSEGSVLAQANRAMRAGLWAQACELYLQALHAQPDSTWLRDNLALLSRQYRRRLHQGAPLSGGVCGWELSHNAAGRAQMLAELYTTFEQVEILGRHFPDRSGHGRSLWKSCLLKSIPRC